MTNPTLGIAWEIEREKLWWIIKTDLSKRQFFWEPSTHGDCCLYILQVLLFQSNGNSSQGIYLNVNQTRHNCKRLKSNKSTLHFWCLSWMCMSTSKNAKYTSRFNHCHKFVKPSILNTYTLLTKKAEFFCTLQCRVFIFWSKLSKKWWIQWNEPLE